MALVLVVDDTPVVRALARAALEDSGMEVEEAADGQEALDRLACPEPVDAVVLDIMMPGLSGFEVLRAMHERSQHGQVPVLMLSCKTDDEDFGQAFALGAVDYLTKPFDPDELVRAVRAAVYQLPA